MKPIELLTNRLILRRARDSDVDYLFHNYCSDINSSRFLTRQPHTNIGQTAHFTEQWCNVNWDNGSCKFAWVISLLDTDEAIGVFLVIRDGHKAEIHYGIGQRFWQQGLMTEVGTVVMEWLMTQSGLQRIWSVCDVENLSSVRLLEKLNFKREGILRKWLVLPTCGDMARDCYMYARTWP